MIPVDRIRHLASAYHDAAQHRSLTSAEREAADLADTYLELHDAAVGLLDVLCDPPRTVGELTTAIKLVRRVVEG